MSKKYACLIASVEEIIRATNKLENYGGRKAWLELRNAVDAAKISLKQLKVKS